MMALVNLILFLSSRQGGSILIIGSAAGVAFMGMEKADFGWYVKKITPWALVGYLGGMGAYLAAHGTQLSAGLLAAAN